MGPSAHTISVTAAVAEKLCRAGEARPVWARPGWLTALSDSQSKSGLYGASVWARRALNGRNWQLREERSAPRALRAVDKLARFSTVCVEKRVAIVMAESASVLVRMSAAWPSWPTCGGNFQSVWCEFAIDLFRIVRDGEGGGRGRRQTEMIVGSYLRARIPTTGERGQPEPDQGWRQLHCRALW